ncbi:MAG: hypothetical protein A4E25_00072 [Methanobacterium sp. PtaB.Bin024]|jgi:hypothetical protein|nr:MAG: hypothetical protein A4E25_00072 [Methanobacterium sp. PtaB.Bin024]OPY29316.1 MAG: hypothetical protein A4E27_00183 [Methanobacterium sp. PtaU1.Bin242]
MKINWEKIPKTQEEIIVTEYIEGKINILERLLDVYTKEHLLTISFTPPPLKGNYYTYEIKFHRHGQKYLINVWKGIRTGDALPILYGYLQ